MRAFVVISLCLCLVLPPLDASAQEAAAQPLQIGPSGQAYLDAITYRGIQTDVGYYDPSGVLPRLETGQEPEPPAADTDIDAPQLSTIRIIAILVASAALIGLALLVWRNAGSFTLSLREDVQNVTRQRRATGLGLGAANGPPADLATILAVQDRRRALVMLAQAALARATAANGVLLQPSWTMRDTLRHLPKAQPHLDALRGLVLFGERVLFGNRDVSEAEFQAQVDTVRPVMMGGAGA
jgi:Domain of unknown function (DUF4129)